ncbi:unnamed protein product [Chrysoparadoxa australica]
MRMRLSLLLGVALAATSHAKVYFKEDFNDEGWRDRWTVPSSWKPKEELGEWGWTAGQWHGDADDKGIQTTVDARHHGLSAKLSEPFTNAGTDLVLQFSVKNEQRLDCGGAYIKLLGEMDQDTFGGATPYQVMFGPDICGSSARTHVIFGYPPKNDNILVRNEVIVEKDQVSHLYTLHVKSDGSYEVYIDQQSVRAGTLEDDFDFLPPRLLNDPSVTKPEGWVDEARIPDPEDVKPEGYDDIPALLPDGDAVKPGDWDDEDDGEWSPPMVGRTNPEYKGPWRPRIIDNPDYKGPWEHPQIANPDYEGDPELSIRCKDCMHIGFELWQVKSGTIFDDIIVTDSLEEAWAMAEATWAAKKEREHIMREQFKAKERAEREAEMEIMRKAQQQQAAATDYASGLGELGEDIFEEEEEDLDDEL